MINAEVKRDLFIIRKSYISNLILLIISIPIWTITYNDLGSLTFTVPFMIYTSLLILEQADDFYKCNLIVNSLPVRRDEIVKAKFKVVIFIYVVYTALVLVVHYIYAVVGITKYMDVESIIIGIPISFLISMLYGGMVIALTVKYGYEKLRYIGIFFTMVLFSMLSIALYLIQKSNIMPIILMFIVVAGILFLIIALKYTLKIYNEKEF